MLVEHPGDLAAPDGAAGDAAPLSIAPLREVARQNGRLQNGRLPEARLEEAPLQEALGDLSTRVLALERQVADLQRGLIARQQVGIAVGLFAFRYSIDVDRSWVLLRRLSQHLNIKVGEIARVIALRHGRSPEAEIDPADAALARSVECLLGNAAVRAVLMAPTTGAH